MEMSAPPKHAGKQQTGANLHRQIIQKRAASVDKERATDNQSNNFLFILLASMKGIQYRKD